MSSTDEEMPDARVNGSLQPEPVAEEEEDDLRINGEPADLIKIRIVRKLSKTAYKDPFSRIM